MRSPKWNLFLLALALAAAISLAAGAPSGAATWGVDQAHTEVNFSVKHFFTPVTGSFDEFEIKLDYNADNPTSSTVDVKIPVSSINTGNEKRDGHLVSQDFFEADKYPYITFKSTSVKANGDDQLVARGQLTIKGESREVDLPITLLGKQELPEQMQQMMGGTKEVASFKASTSVDRNDYGVGVGNWAATMIVGGDVAIEILLEAHRK
ncbi:MAG: YceI family protein [Thermoanaerobaculia bacterium]|jgi:polyisoprenoid-binding protein YceI